jgi:hypothetical protein
VISIGYKTNLAVWVCGLLQQEFSVSKINISQLFSQDSYVQTYFTFSVSCVPEPNINNNTGYEGATLVKVSHSSRVSEVCGDALDQQNICLVGAGGACSKTLFTATHLMKLQFRIQDVQVFQVWHKQQIRIGVRVLLCANE